MSQLYGILAMAGWAWTLVAGVYLFLKLRSARRWFGFEVIIKTDEQQR
jgi:hypothetical protein